MRLIRIAAVLTGGLTIAYQLTQGLNGARESMFIIADYLAAGFLVLSALIPDQPAARKFLLAAFGWMGGVFLVATFGPLTTETGGFGPITTTVGIGACVICTLLLIRKTN